jgi:hypothetical protein
MRRDPLAATGSAQRVDDSLGWIRSSRDAVLDRLQAELTA